MKIISFPFNFFQINFLNAAADTIRTQHKGYENLVHIPHFEFRDADKILTEAKPDLIVFDYSWIHFSDDMNEHQKQNDTPILVIKNGSSESVVRKFRHSSFVTAIEPRDLTSSAIVPIIVGIFEQAASGKINNDFQSRVSNIISNTLHDPDFEVRVLSGRGYTAPIRA
jgi:hypothetical protein